MKYFIVFLILSPAILSCTKKGPEPINENLIPFSSNHRILADQIISCFENSDPVLHYDYIENIGDGRGYTAGRAGFTSATGDMLSVIQIYTEIVPKNILSKYMHTIENYSSTENSSTVGLENLPLDWKTACIDPVFIKCQDKIVDSFYYDPAVNYCKDLNLKYPLSLLNLYDAIIQHGDGEDPDGLGALIDKTTQRCGGSPADGIHEYKWLETFNDVRKHDLKHAHEKETREEWRESKDRAIVLDDLRKNGNFLLEGKITIKVYGDRFNLPAY